MKERWNFWTSRALLILAVAGLLTGCNKPQSPDPSAGGAGGAGVATDNVIKVGEYASLTGTEATFGQSSHNGTALAIDEINAAGGVLGKQIKLLYEDNQSKAGESAAIVLKLISRDKVAAVLGEVASGRSLEAAPICQQNKVPMISPSSTNPEVTKRGEYIFRICFLDSFQGAVLARFAKETLKATRVAILTDVRQPYSVGLAEFFRQRFVQDGGAVVAEQKYSGGDKDFNAVLTATKAADPQAIFVPGYYTEAGLIARQARQLGINVPLFGGDGWESPKLIEIGGAAVEGTYYSTHYSPEDQSPVVQNFVKKYQERYKETPDAMAALGYDSAMVLADAIKRAGSTEGPKIRDALAATKDFHGVTGRTMIDAERNASKPAVMVTIKDGKFKYVETLSL
ncbi:MAG: ABC transporter substrate-binding protein [Verrucomicrobia bacterium]|nr:ABC transporter substrate-binding protein [Verrucomicrobiota bacterium]